MGNHASCVTVGSIKETIQLVRSDGSVQILDKPLCAGQIMQGFPQHLVCRSDSFYIGQKTPALSPNGQLKLGNRYFILPDHFFQSPLSLVSLASLISPLPPPPQIGSAKPTARVSPSLRSIGRAAVLFQPFEIQNSGGGGIRIRIHPEFISKLMENRRLSVGEIGHSVSTADSADSRRGLCNTPELQKDYAQLVKSRSQCWRPKLESIGENEKKVGHKIIKKIKRSGRLYRSSSV